MNSPSIGPRATATLISLSLLSTVLGGAAAASSYDNKPKILLHVQETTTKVPCSKVNITDCRDAVTEGDLVSGDDNFYFTYLLTERGDLPQPVGALQLGISYQEDLPGNIVDGAGIDIFSWTLCAAWEGPQPDPAWPSPQGGNLIVFAREDVDDNIINCQPAIGVVGYFYVGAYSQDALQVIPRPIDGAAKLGTCFLDGEYYLDTSDLGSATFSSGATDLGCNPCDGPCPLGVPAVPATWSSIKSHVR